jgi:gamma-glutamylcyclotransferase (GGCT)/AIG2-like uncharacterized protein YtfP
MDSTRLFVYGTLKRGGELHSELLSQNAHFLGKARIKGHLFKIPGESYPGALPGDSEEYISGELYELKSPRSALKKIDEIEGCDEGLFERKMVDTWMGDRKTRAWTYFYAKPLKKGPRLTTGYFPARSRSKARHV